MKGAFFKDEEEVLEYLRKNASAYSTFHYMDLKWRQRFMDYCCGKKTLPITYDPFFKRIFHPDVHPERLSRLISSLLEIPVKVVKILPTEETLLDGGQLLIMDILVQLEDGALANVEVQKIPYYFQGERISCYSSDLVLRQYSRVKGEKGRYFKYNDMKKVYTIVIFEESTAIFHEKGMHYLHHGKTCFDTGLKMDLLQEYCFLALDVFRTKPYHKNRNEQTAWIAFLATDCVETAEELCEEFPWLEEIYAEMADYLHKPEEVLGMFSDMLKIMDQNTVQYMIEEQQRKLEAVQQDLEVVQQDLTNREQELEVVQQDLTNREQELEAVQQDLTNREQELEAVQQDLTNREQELEVVQQDLTSREQELEALKSDALYNVISLCFDMGGTEAEAAAQVQKRFDLSSKDAENAVKQALSRRLG